MKLIYVRKNRKTAFALVFLLMINGAISSSFGEEPKNRYSLKRSAFDEEAKEQTETIQTLKGRTYKVLKRIKVEPDGITVQHPAGISKLKFSNLREPIRKKYNYDPEKAEKYAEKVAQHRRKVNSYYAEMAEIRRQEKKLFADRTEALTELRVQEDKLLATRRRLRENLDNAGNTEYKFFVGVEVGGLDKAEIAELHYQTHGLPGKTTRCAAPQTERRYCKDNYLRSNMRDTSFRIRYNGDQNKYSEAELKSRIRKINAKLSDIRRQQIIVKEKYRKKLKRLKKGSKQSEK